MFFFGASSGDMKKDTLAYSDVLRVNDVKDYRTKFFTGKFKVYLQNSVMVVTPWMDLMECCLGFWTEIHVLRILSFKLCCVDTDIL